MPITLNAVPAPYLWTKNPVAYVFDYSLMDTSNALQVKVLMLGKEVLLQYPFRSSSGTITVYLEQIVDALTPYFPLPTQTTQVEILTVPTFRVSYRVYGSGLSLTWIAAGSEKYCFKGGISDMIYTREQDTNKMSDALSNYQKFNRTPSRFMTWKPSGSLVASADLGWLLFVLPNEFGLAAQYTFYRMDGSIATRNLPIGSGTTFPFAIAWIPIGVEALQFFWGIMGPMARMDITVNSGYFGSFSYTVLVDNRPCYDSLCVYYRNSLGGLDTFRFRGNTERSSSTERLEYRQDRNSGSGGPNPWYKADTRLKWKTNTGYLSRQQMGALLDLIASKEVYIAQDLLPAGVTAASLLSSGNYLLPVRITTKEFTYRDTKDGLYNEVIELETAGTFETLPHQFPFL